MSALYLAPTGLIALFLVLFMLGALELGHRYGLATSGADRQFSTISTSVLALIGLLLAFSFSLAADREAARRRMAVQATNSIGTFWLRTELFPEPVRSEMRSRVRRYVDLHFEHRAARVDTAELARVEAEAQRLQRELWALLVQETERDPQSRSLLLVTPALNAMIDDASSAIAAKENRLPDALLLLLFLLVVLAAFLVGYGTRTEKRNLVLWCFFIIFLGSVLLILVDLDRPRRGLIRTDPKPYLRLRETIEEG